MFSLSSPLTQTILGTLFTWGMTALGALGCLLHYSKIESRKLLDASLGFSAGVMLAASYWSLLSPAEEMAINSGYGSLSFIPLAIGLLLGASFVFLADKYAPISSFTDFSIIEPESKRKSLQLNNVITSDRILDNSSILVENRMQQVRQRLVVTNDNDDEQQQQPMISVDQSEPRQISSNKRAQTTTTIVSKRLLLMMIAITMHNIPEGLAVGVAFGAVGNSGSSTSSNNGGAAATLANARNLAIGIGIQNFPEGLAVSLPLKAAGMSTLRSVWYGQLSGLVEPIAGIIGCLAVQSINSILPFALSFAAGAMIFVVLDDIIPEYQMMGNGQLASICAIVGFVVMMCLDMGLS